MWHCTTLVEFTQVLASQIDSYIVNGWTNAHTWNDVNWRYQANTNNLYFTHTHHLFQKRLIILQHQILPLHLTVDIIILHQCLIRFTNYSVTHYYRSCVHWQRLDSLLQNRLPSPRLSTRTPLLPGYCCLLSSIFRTMNRHGACLS